jgi:hypothetical protein
VKLINQGTRTVKDDPETYTYVHDLKFITLVISQAGALEDLELPPELFD